MCQHERVITRKIAQLLGAVTVTMYSALLGAPSLAPLASAADCPDIDVTFARATSEPPGVGVVGQEFIDALRSHIGGRSVGVYPVNYPATFDFVPSANAGANDANAHVESMAANCPNTKLVLGGYSQGALVIDLITIAQFPLAGFEPNIVPEDVANHVAALALFGNPADRYLRESVSTASPWYGAKTIDMCAPGDRICATDAGLSVPTPDEMGSAEHLSYPHSPMPGQAAAFVAGRV
jgi:cutinase